MTADQRKENLSVMRQIQKSDLPDLLLRKDHAGWVEANNDLKRRYKRDPWFGVNERLRNAHMFGRPQEKIDELKALAKKMGGPPPGVETEGKDYASHTEIYDIGITESRQESMIEEEIRKSQFKVTGTIGKLTGPGDDATAHAIDFTNKVNVLACAQFKK